MVVPCAGTTDPTADKRASVAAAERGRPPYAVGGESVVVAESMIGTLITGTDIRHRNSGWWGDR